jgi:hypothetical protein
MSTKFVTWRNYFPSEPRALLTLIQHEPEMTPTYKAMWQALTLGGIIVFAAIYATLLLACQGRPAKIIFLLVTLTGIAFFVLPQLLDLAIRADYPEVFGK